MPTMLSLCDRTGVMARPWAEAGYDALCVDVQHPLYPKTKQVGEGTITFVQADLRTWLPPRLEYVFVAGFPPCTDLAVSGSKHMRQKGLRRRGQAIELVGAVVEIAEWTGAPYCVENPVGILSTHWEPPQHKFHPHQYGGYPGGEGDGYTKQTHLWTGHGFVMPEPKPIELDPDKADWIHKAPPTADRGDVRSVTPAGFARAVFEANRPGAVRPAEQLEVTA